MQLLIETISTNNCIKFANKIQFCFCLPGVYLAGIYLKVIGAFPF